jgi:DnaJ-class molecular chaperone
MVAKKKTIKKVKCPTCDGDCFVLENYDPSPQGVALSSGFMQIEEDCPSCKGKGLVTPKRSKEIRREMKEEQEADWAMVEEMVKHQKDPGSPTTRMRRGYHD